MNEICSEEKKQAILLDNWNLYNSILYLDYKWKYWHDKAEKDNYSVSVDDNNNTITIPLKKGWSDNKDAYMPVDESDTVILCRLD